MTNLRNFPKHIMIAYNNKTVSIFTKRIKILPIWVFSTAYLRSKSKGAGFMLVVVEEKVQGYQALDGWCRCQCT